MNNMMKLYENFCKTNGMVENIIMKCKNCGATFEYSQQENARLGNPELCIDCLRKERKSGVSKSSTKITKTRKNKKDKHFKSEGLEVDKNVEESDNVY